jgi:hypothetical protein
VKKVRISSRNAASSGDSSSCIDVPPRAECPHHGKRPEQVTHR